MRISPLIALVFNFTLPVVIMFPGNRYQHLFFMAFALAVLLISGKTARAMKFAVVYAALYGLQLWIFRGDNNAGMFLSMMLMMSIQFIPCFIMASMLVKDYSSSELISALEPFHIPKPLIVSLAIVVRYIPTFKNEFRFMKESMRLRNIPFSWKKPFKSFEYFLVPQLFRCSILAAEITAAALTRGITNPRMRTSYFDVGMRVNDYIICAVLFAGTGVSIVWK